GAPSGRSAEAGSTRFEAGDGAARAGRAPSPGGTGRGGAGRGGGEGPPRGAPPGAPAGQGAPGRGCGPGAGRGQAARRERVPPGGTPAAAQGRQGRAGRLVGQGEGGPGLAGRGPPGGDTPSGREGTDGGRAGAGARAPAGTGRRRSARCGAAGRARGPVNRASVEEYEEVKKRHAFPTAQRDDLLEAKEKLDQVIARIDRESVEKLQDVYAKVRAAFAATFTRLFGGGKADLLFTDPDDPLESGIDIVVQPPGKRLQNLLALSGGEKALAAIALLFALLEVKPSPFCVLDEIDAALDDHNLERFRALLVEYAARTQFLVITHRQTTMEGADSLFGVTMEEAGVSTLVSLDLERVKTVS